MPLVITPAIVLASLRYSETSKIVRLATREHGVQSGIAKGARVRRVSYSAKSKSFYVTPTDVGGA